MGFVCVYDIYIFKYGVLMLWRGVYIKIIW